MSVDLKLSQAHDLLLKSGKLVLVGGAAKKAQQVKIALLTFAGEWQFDTTAGVPYLDEVLVKTPNLTKISALLRQKILAVDGIERLTAFSVGVSRQTRTLTVEFEAETAQGKISDKVTLGVNS